jgi:hypothetical protein
MLFGMFSQQANGGYLILLSDLHPFTFYFFLDADSRIQDMVYKHIKAMN